MKPLSTKLKSLLQQETVLTIAAVLAILSAFVIHPDQKYIAYIDFRTLGILFSLMTVMAGWRRQGVFDRLGQALLAKTGGMLTLVLVLVGLCFFCSMLITNDVALMTFVPFTFAVFHNLGESVRKRLVIPVVCMQTIAANLGSMLTPIGNPQNLYLYGKSGLSLWQFMAVMLPYTVAAMVLLVAWALFLCRGQKGRLAVEASMRPSAVTPDKKLVIFYGLLFFMSLLSVVHLIPYPIVFAVVLVGTFLADRVTLQKVDYSLLLTFIAFFIFIGNLGRIPAFSEWLQDIIAGREVPVAVLASQIISNVPAALLLSGFTENVKALMIGTNLGGLGTLIASMASLISYRQLVRELPQEKGRYFRLFTISNIVFLILLMLL